MKKIDSAVDILRVTVEQHGDVVAAYETFNGSGVVETIIDLARDVHSSPHRKISERDTVYHPPGKRPPLPNGGDITNLSDTSTYIHNIYGE